MAQPSEDWRGYRRAAQEAPLLQGEVERVLLRAAQQHDASAVREIVASHMRLVVDVASRHARPGLSAHDLVAEGIVGLLEAVRRFDLAHTTRFSSYAVWWVRARISHYALANRRIVGMPSTRGARTARAGLHGAVRTLTQQLARAPSVAELADALGVREDEVAAVERALSGRDVSLSQREPGEPADEHPGPERLVADAEEASLCHEALRQAFAFLTERERHVVRQRLADDGTLSLTELGRELGVSRQRAGQILATACEKLRGSMGHVAPAQLC